MDISLSKPRYRCQLVSWYTPNSRRPDEVRAVVIRKETHRRLGPPNGKTSITSRVLWIDTRNKLIETVNSVYDWS